MHRMLNEQQEDALGQLLNISVVHVFANGVIRDRRDIPNTKIKKQKTKNKQTNKQTSKKNPNKTKNKQCIHTSKANQKKNSSENKQEIKGRLGIGSSRTVIFSNSMCSTIVHY